MRLYRGIALPTDLATTFTSTFAIASSMANGLKEKCSRVSGPARSWYERSEGAEILHLAKGLASLLCIDPAKSAAALLGLSQEEDDSGLERAKVLMHATLYVSWHAARGILKDTLELSAKSLIAPDGLDEYLGPFLEYSVRSVGPPVYFLAMAAYVVVSMLGEYERPY